jgi:hypothetical protein
VAETRILGNGRRLKTVAQPEPGTQVEGGRCHLRPGIAAQGIFDNPLCAGDAADWK